MEVYLNRIQIQGEKEDVTDSWKAIDENKSDGIKTKQSTKNLKTSEFDIKEASEYLKMKTHNNNLTSDFDIKRPTSI